MAETLRVPMVWVLHIAYGWIVIYLVLRGLAALGMVSELLAVDALTIGALGGMTIGMMTRTASGIRVDLAHAVPYAARASPASS